MQHALISQVRRRLRRRPRHRLRRRPWRSINALTVWFVIVTFTYLKRVDDGLQTANGIIKLRIVNTIQISVL